MITTLLSDRSWLFISRVRSPSSSPSKRELLSLSSHLMSVTTTGMASFGTVNMELWRGELEFVFSEKADSTYFCLERMSSTEIIFPSPFNWSTNLFRSSVASSSFSKSFITECSTWGGSRYARLYTSPPTIHTRNNTYQTERKRETTSHSPKRG